MERIRLAARSLAGLVGLLSVWPAMAAKCDLAHAPAVPVVRNLPYQQARALILAGGWHTLPGRPHNGLSANETGFRERGFAELQFCRMTDDSTCRFAFRAGAGAVLWITTTGDEDATLGTVATVKAARLACAEDGDPG